VDEQMRTLLEKPIKETDTRAFVLVKSIYQACMNTTEIEAHSVEDLKRTLRGMGGWPVVEGQRWNERGFDWTNTIYEFMKFGFNSNIFFEFNVSPNVSDSSKDTLTVSPQETTKWDNLIIRDI
jgi:membrane metallo-endopeptidase-like protein 1